MTPAQSKAARALIDYTQPQLAEAAGLGLSTVVDFERSRRAVSAEAVGSMKAALEVAGVEFIPENGGGAGVRLRKKDRSIDHAKPEGPATDAVDAMDKAIERNRKK